MSKRVVIIGAVALGPKVACRLRRIDPEAEITVIDRDSLISYGGCGIPYYVGGDVADIESLYSTSAHAVRDIDFFRTCKDINIISGVEAIGIDRQSKRVAIHHLDDGRKEELEYDKLVIATGSTPIRPDFPGVNLPRVFTISNLHSARAIKDLVSKGLVENAVVIGAGAVGIEMAEALSDLWDINTTIVEMAEQVLPTALSRGMARLVENELKKNSVKVMLSQRVIKINGDKTGVCSVDTTSGAIPCDLVVLSAGVKPNTEFASRAGLALGSSGALLVDRRMRTTDPDIYAGGDCVEVRNLVSGKNMTMPLGSLANRQGRTIAINISGGTSNFKGAVGTFCIKVFGMGIAKAGLTFKQALASGFDPVYSIVAQDDRAHFYPTAQLMYIKLIADRKSRKILGIEAVGANGDAVKARVDALAPLIAGGVEVEDVCSLETAYAPPFASAMDIINNAGNALDNIFDKRNRPIDVIDFLEDFSNGRTRVLDVRNPKEASSFIKKYGDKWINIPQSELKSRLDEVPRDEPLCLLCNTGPRSYEAQIFLEGNGIVNTRNIQGGYGMIRAIDSKFVK